MSVYLLGFLIAIAYVTCLFWNLFTNRGKKVTLIATFIAIGYWVILGLVWYIKWFLNSIPE